MSTDLPPQDWLTVTLSRPLGGQWTGSMEAQTRYSPSLARFQELTLRPALQYRISPVLAVGQGAAYIPRFAGGHEIRLFQQSAWQIRAKQARLVFRSRLEERWNPQNPFSLRLRQMIRLEQPVGPLWGLCGAVEGFWELVPSPEYVRTRYMIGVRREISSNLRVETGPMFQKDRDSRLWTWQISVRMDL